MVCICITLILLCIVVICKVNTDKQYRLWEVTILLFGMQFFVDISFVDEYVLIYCIFYNWVAITALVSAIMCWRRSKKRKQEETVKEMQKQIEELKQQVKNTEIDKKESIQ